MSHWLSIVFLFMCSCDKPKSSFGTFDEVQRNVLARHCDVMNEAERNAPHGTMSCTLEPWIVDERGVGTKRAECPCAANLVVHRASNGKDVDQIDLDVQHCERGTLAQLAVEQLGPFIEKSARDQLASLMSKPAGDDAAAKYVQSVTVLGGVTLKVTWSRDAYDDGGVQSTESVTASIAPKKASDTGTTQVSKDAHVTGRPRCP